MRTHYETLGLKPGASLDEIKGAYRALARQEHPDVSSRGDAADRFRAIQEAYEVLADERRRTAYDAILKAREGGDKEKRRQEKERQEAEELRRRAEERMRDAVGPDRADPEEVRRLTGLLNAGRFNDAEALAQQMLMRQSRQPVPYAVLGDLCRMRGELPKALEMYGYAAQFEPSNSVYQRKYEEVMAALNDPAEYRPMSTATPDLNLQPLIFAGLVAGIGLALLFLVGGAPGGTPPFAWSPGAVLGLAVTGLAAGSGLSLSGAISRFRAVNGSAVFKVPPVTLLGLVSIVFFWAAVALYFLVGTRQQAFNRSLSLLLGVCGVATVVLALAGWTKGGDVALSILLLGGNVTFLGATIAWAVCDGLRPTPGRASQDPR